MRAVVLALLLVVGLAACKREPSFDERYAKARQHIRAKAAAIDAELKTGGGPRDAPAPPDGAG